MSSTFSVPRLRRVGPTFDMLNWNMRSAASASGCILIAIHRDAAKRFSLAFATPRQNAVDRIGERERHECSDVPCAQGLP